MKFTSHLIGLFSLFYCFSASAQEETGPTPAEYGTVLNLSGKQRMLSQKMCKEILLIALDINKPQNLKNLQGTAALFDKTLKGLRDGDTDLGLPKTSSKRILRQLGMIENQWNAFQPIVEGVLSAGLASMDDVKGVAEKNLPLLDEMNRGVKLYEMDASKSGLQSDPGLAVAINLSGKQRMLSQKMSKEFFLIALGHEVQANKLSLLETTNLFDRTLIGLLDGDPTLDLNKTNQQNIRDQLAKVKVLWEAFKPVLDKAAQAQTQSLSHEDMVKVADLNLPLLKEMNEAVGLYEAEAGKQ